MTSRLMSLVLVSFLVPQIVFGAWWNPLSWGIFHKRVEVATTTATTTVAKPTPKPAPRSSQADIDDISSVLNSVILDNTTLLNYSLKFVDEMSEDPYSGYDLKTSTLAELDSWRVEVQSFSEEMYAQIEQIKSSKYVDDNYWKNVGIPRIVGKEKQHQDKVLAIISKYKASRRRPSSYSQPVYQYSAPTYTNPCIAVEKDLRDNISNSGGLATESQVQALLRNKGC